MKEVKDLIRVKHRDTCQVQFFETETDAIIHCMNNKDWVMVS